MSGTPCAVEHRDVSALDEDTWLRRLVESVDNPIIEDRLYPGFPDEATQKAFVGSAYADALGEASRFYAYVRPRAERRLSKKYGAGRYLDFGCGWGRIGRFFLRDYERGDMVGVDIDPGMVDFCRQASMPGSFEIIANGRPLPYHDGAFQLVTAYSVFTHLPERLFKAWMSELLRVTKPGGLIVFTVEPQRFLDFVAGIDPHAPESGWHAALQANLGDVSVRRQDLAKEGFTFLPTGGGPYRASDVYGDMVVNPDFIAECAKNSPARGRLVEYLDDPARFWQAVAVVKREHFSFFGNR
jgi:SAM-dependent methyltransferase